MADAASKENTPRTFVKDGPNGEKLIRSVTSVQAEVEAKFDGYREEKSSSKSSGGNSGRSGSTNSGGGSNASAAS